ncbi:MAG: A24 family peptidase [Lachnospiraceae bacterium]|nr:A24 family peptidase [Lachnospiraceae bacterium]
MTTDVLFLLKIIFATVILACACAADIRSRRIPNLCPALLAAGGAVFLVPEFILFRDEVWALLSDSILAAVLCLIFFLVIHGLSHGGIGFGDIKLFSALGFLLGAEPLLYTVFFSFLLFACVSVILLLLKKKRREDTLPFAPFILTGFLGSFLLSCFF